MGFIGYFVKLIHIPMYVASQILIYNLIHSHVVSSNNILVCVSHSWFFPETNVLQQRWSIVDFGVFAFCMLCYFMDIISFLVGHTSSSDDRRMSWFNNPPAKMIILLLDQQ